MGFKHGQTLGILLDHSIVGVFLILEYRELKIVWPWCRTFWRLRPFGKRKAAKSEVMPWHHSTIHREICNTIWLVVWNIFYFSVSWNNHPNWLILSEGLKPQTRNGGHTSCSQRYWSDTLVFRQVLTLSTMCHNRCLVLRAFIQRKTHKIGCTEKFRDPPSFRSPAYLDGKSRGFV